MNGFPEPIERMIKEFSRLPGVGRRSAERMAFYILKQKPEDAMRLSRAIDEVTRNVRPCAICGNLAHTDPCLVCRDDRRDASTVLVVEQTRDLISLEETGAYRGVYHVLGGRIDPLAKVEPGALSIDRLFERIDHPETNSRGEPVREVILGLNPDLEGDSTGLFLTDQLAGRDVVVTRLARGLPSGSQLEYVSQAVLTDAINGRQPLTPQSTSR